MHSDIIYCRKNENIELIYYNNSTLAYPVHTHTNHVTFGYVVKGSVCIVEKNENHVYHAGEYFCILPDMPHTLSPENDEPYSMIIICVHRKCIEMVISEKDTNTGYTQQLKHSILQMPQEVISIKDMSQRVNVSPYHMIREFKNVCGLTPHQFQIQCRIRRAQKLLEEGKSVTEVAYEMGFCDQSHFDRCFRKIVRLTPSDYKRVAK